ncbi:MAG: hypothetical protein JSU72_15065 [Deltaproteobacteria bacterium]|nr:MAG: hypothetical protein JSU72_15065 [Deltaproteobacteria bacterium]
MEAPNHLAVSHLQKIISNLVAKPVQLTITDNSFSMINVTQSNSGYALRLHHMFLDADEEVLSSLAYFVRSSSRKVPSVLRHFVEANSDRIRKAPPKRRKTALRTVGRFFDLRAIFDQMNHEYFDGKIDCLITWGAKRRIRRQKSIRLATYSEDARTIRINPILDRSYVPKYVVQGIVYHEMLHHFLGVECCNGRRIAHSKAFRRLEAEYRHHHRLQSWKKNNLERLLGR